MASFRGTVAGLWRYPVKSMGGERVPALRVDARGAAGDRTHAVWGRPRADADPRALTARETKGLLRWQASYAEADPEPSTPPPPRLVDPDGTTIGWEDPELAERLAADLDHRTVRLERDLAGQQDLERSLLVTTSASLRALASELGAPVTLDRFRTNVHLDLDAPAWAELGWEGGRIAFGGGVELELLHPCERCVIPTRQVEPDGELSRWPALLTHLVSRHGRCFGMNARVVVAGRIAAGEPASLELSVS